MLVLIEVGLMELAVLQAAKAVPLSNRLSTVDSKMAELRMISSCNKGLISHDWPIPKAGLAFELD